MDSPGLEISRGYRSARDGDQEDSVGELYTHYTVCVELIITNGFQQKSSVICSNITDGYFLKPSVIFGNITDGFLSKPSVILHRRFLIITVCAITTCHRRFFGENRL